MRRLSWRKALSAAVLIPTAAILAPWLLARGRPATRFLLERSTGRGRRSQPLTAGSLAGELWGEDEANSHSAGAQRVRAAARDLFPRQAPGQGGEWHFTPAQVQKLKTHLEEE
jgi:hypothetical protein